jgi:hypothetical protein
MKPISRLNPGRKQFDSIGVTCHQKFPQVDFYFQEPTLGNGDSSGNPWPRFSSAGGFHQVSGRYIARETNRHFVAEAIVFGIIIGVSAWPIVSMIRALPQLFR